MKKIIAAVFLLILILSGPLFGAGTLTLSSTADIVSGGPSKILTIAGVGDSSDGTFPALAIDVASQKIANTFLTGVEYDPGNVTVPNTVTVKLYYTDDYTANTTNAADLLGGAGATLSATATTNLIPIVDLTNLTRGYKYIRGNLTLVITQTAVAVNSATIGIKLTFAR